MPNILVDEEVYGAFEKAVIARFGYKRGNKKMAANEAIAEWTKKVTKQ